MLLDIILFFTINIAESFQRTFYYRYNLGHWPSNVLLASILQRSCSNITKLSSNIPALGVFI